MFVSELERFKGAMFGSAIGDAFGYPLQRLSYREICEKFEDIGALELAISAKADAALFTDATQMALFTIDGIIWADIYGKAYDNTALASYVFYSYQLWLYTQTKTVAGKEYAWLFDKKQNPHLSPLVRVKGLARKRYSIETNIKALLAAHDDRFGRLNAPVNTNRDNCAVKRITPVGLFYGKDEEMAFRMGCDVGAITHSHPDGYLPCGVYAAIIARLLKGKSIENSVKYALKILEQYKGAENCYNAVMEAFEKAEDGVSDPQKTVKALGLGFVGTEAIAIAVYCAILHQSNFKFAIELAANHDGDSATCAALTGGILGAYYGFKDIPNKWYSKLQYKSLIESVTESLYKRSEFAGDDEVDDDE